MNDPGQILNEPELKLDTAEGLGREQVLQSQDPMHHAASGLCCREQADTRHQMRVRVFRSLCPGIVVGAIIFTVGHFVGQGGGWFVAEMSQGSIDGRVSAMQESGRQAGKVMVLTMDCLSIIFALTLAIIAAKQTYRAYPEQLGKENTSHDSETQP